MLPRPARNVLSAIFRHIRIKNSDTAVYKPSLFRHKSI
jgi:hypothetical protein